MADDWDVVSTAPVDDGWSVTTSRPIDQRDLGERYVENAVDAGARNPTIAAGRNAFTNPLSAIPGLGAQVPDLFSALGPVGAAARAGLAGAGLASRFTPGLEKLAPGMATGEKARRETYEQRSTEDPFYAAPGGLLGKTAAGAATLAGQFSGAMTDPQNFVNAGSSVLKRALVQGGVNAAGDVQTQASDVGAGIQDEWKPLQTVTAGAFGAALSGAGDAAAAAGRQFKAVKDFNPMAHHGPASHADVWDNLIAQESGGDQSAVSPKGARGVAQIMPDTARYVAGRLGQPRLATLAFEDSDEGRAANELLGRAYYDEQLQNFGGDHILASAAYNAGPGRVRAWVKAFGKPSEIGAQAFVDRIPFAETQDYVRNVARSYLGTPPEPAARAPEPAAQAPEAPAAPPGLITGEKALADAAARAAAARAQMAEPIAKGPLDEPAPAQPPPIEAKAAPEPVGETWTPVEVKPFDAVDQALETIRSGVRVQQDRGPTLMRALLDEGGIRADSGDIGDLDLKATQGRLGGMLVRKNGGKSLEEAAVWAQDHGFLKGRYDDDAYGRASAQDLLDALREENAGNPVYAREDGPGAAHQDMVDQLDEALAHIGLDPHKLTNDQIKAAIDEYYAAQDHGMPPPGQGPYEDLGDLFGLGGRQRSVSDSGGRDALMPGQLGSTKGAMFGQRNPSAIAAADPNNVPEIQGLKAMAQELTDALGLTHRQGRIRMRGALGTYDRKSGVIRTLGMQEMNVLAHEAGHALEFTHRIPQLEAVMKKFAKRLKELDYDPKKARRHEGFAEFLRLYMTNPDMAKQFSPGFYDAFENALEVGAPQILKDLQRIQTAYEAYQVSPSVAVTASMIVEPPKHGVLSHLKEIAERRGVKAAISEFFSEGFREMYWGGVDQHDPVKRAVDQLIAIKERNTGAPVDLTTAQNPYRGVRSAVGAPAAGHMDLMHGVHPYHSLEAEGPSLADAIAEALGEGNIFQGWKDGPIKLFGDYLAARRFVAEHARYAAGDLGTKPVLEPEVWAQTVADLDKANPTWASAAQKVYEWTNNLWKKRFEGGFITPEQYELGLEHEDYVPVFRDMTDKQTAGMGRRGSNSKNAGGVKRFKGESERAIINPLHSLMLQAYELNHAIALNDARKALDDLAQSAGPDGGAIAERIPTHEIRGQKIAVKELIQNAIDQGALSERDELTLSDALGELDEKGEPTAMLYRAGEINEKGEPIIYVWRDGEKVGLRLPDGKWGKHMMESLSGMTRPIRSTALDIASVPAQWLRFGVTAHPQFFLANTIRDQLTAMINTDVGYKAFASQARGLADEVTQADLTRHYNVMGGEVGGAQTASQHAARQEHKLDAVRKAGYPIRRFGGGLKGIAQLTELSETGTRLGIFRHALEKAQKAGLDEWSAAREAEFQARDYMDFDRRGGWGAMQVAVRLIPFLNASLQAVDKSRRVAGGIFHARDVARALTGGPPVSEADKAAYAHALKFWTATSAMAAASLALRAFYADDPEYDEVAGYLRDTHWVFRLPNHELLAVPKPFDLAALSNIAERAYEGIYLKDPEAWKRLAVGMGTLFIPAHDAPIIGLPFQLAANRDAFGAPIVPDHLQKMEPEDQVGSRTSEMAKALGHWLKQSPAQIEHVAMGISGSIGRDLIKGTDALAHPDAPVERSAPNTFAVGRFIKDWTRGTVSSKKFWDLISDNGGKWTAAKESFGYLYNQGQAEKAMERLGKMDPGARGYTLVSVLGKGDEKLIHPLIRQARTAGVYSDIISDLHDGNIRGVDLQPIPLTPHERREALDGLNAVAVAEKRNALIEAGAPGWQNKQPLDTAKYMAEVPEPIRRSLGVRLQIEFGNAPPLATPEEKAQWQKVRAIVESPKFNAEAIKAVMEAKRVKGRSGMERQFREVASAR